MPEDARLAQHYRDQAVRLRIMAVVFPGKEFKADLRDTARMYESFAEKLEASLVNPLAAVHPETAMRADMDWD